MFGSLERASSLIYDAENKGIEVEAFPLRSVEGQLIASIKTWGAISSNCANSDVAYDFLREFLLEDSQWETNRNGKTDYIDGVPVRPKAEENETVNTLLWTPMDQARFTIKEEYTFERSTLQALYNVTSNTSNFPEGTLLPSDFEIVYTYTASNIDIDAVAQELIDELRWHISEG